MPNIVKCFEYRGRTVEICKENDRTFFGFTIKFTGSNGYPRWVPWRYLGEAVVVAKKNVDLSVDAEKRQIREMVEIIEAERCNVTRV